MSERTHVMRRPCCSFRCRCSFCCCRSKSSGRTSRTRRLEKSFSTGLFLFNYSLSCSGNLMTITIGKYQHILVFEFLYPRLVMFGQKFSFNLWLFRSFLCLFWLIKSPPAHLVRLFPPHITAVSQALQISLATLLLVVHPLQTHLWATRKSKI